MVIVAALYKFTSLTDLPQLQIALHNLTKKHGIFGTLLLAAEGINGTVSGSRDAIDALKTFFVADSRFLGMEYKESTTTKNPFYRIKVKIKKEIVTFGQPQANPNIISGTYVDAQQWNTLLNDPEVIVIDVRNHYEVALGTFKNSIDPKTTSFGEFPEFVQKNLNPTKHKKIAMSCTGGIRCEKASSYMKSAGFSEVYHLKGGILKYLETTKKEESLWQGECFVFDQRVAVTHGLEQGSFTLCFGCRLPLSENDRKSPDFIEGVSCSHCAPTRTEEQKRASRSRQQQMKLAEHRGTTHLGPHQAP